MKRTLPVALPTFLAILCLTTQGFANVGITSVTAGDPLGQPPAAPERVLRVGIDILANERVSTGTVDRAHLVFLDGTALTVGPNSTIVIDKYVFDPARNAGEVSLSTAKGVFRLVGGSISKTNEIKVTTPSATIGIRGGIATIEVGAGGATKATFLYGDKMTVTNQGATQVATRHGSQIESAVDRPPSQPIVVPQNGLAPTAPFERAPAPATPSQNTQPATRPALQSISTTTTTTTTSTQPSPTVTTTTSPTQIDTALKDSSFGTDNSGLPIQKLRREAQINQSNRGASDTAGLPGDNRQGANRMAGPAINAVLRLQVQGQRAVTANTARQNGNANANGSAGAGSGKNKGKGKGQN